MQGLGDDLLASAAVLNLQRQHATCREPRGGHFDRAVERAVKAGDTL